VAAAVARNLPWHRPEVTEADGNGAPAAASAAPAGPLASYENISYTEADCNAMVRAMLAATDVADWIVRFRNDDLAAPVDAMSLDKLSYYAQCFWLALHRERLFEDEIRAWRHGPVIRSIYDAYREHGAQPIIPTGRPAIIEKAIEEFLESVVIFFGGYTAIQLSNATHAEEPWIKARKGYSRRDNSDVLMPVDFLRSYYCRLISDGELALSQHELLDVVPEPRWAAYYVAGISRRLMQSHPLYHASLAKRLLEPVPELGTLADDFFSPIGKPDFVEFEDNAA
jgi:uncharacterized phage-associated protein